MKVLFLQMTNCVVILEDLLCVAVGLHQFFFIQAQQELTKYLKRQ